MAKKRRRRDGFLAVCPTCNGEGEFLFPDPPDVSELGTSRLPCGVVVLCYVCRGAGSVWRGQLA